MKVIIILSILLFISVSSLCQSRGDEITFTARVDRMAPRTPKNGDIIAYRLVRYKIFQVKRGFYENKMIVVDHPIVSGKELESISVGDWVEVTVRQADSIDVRINSRGIRAPEQHLNTFFIARKMHKIQKP